MLTCSPTSMATQFASVAIHRAVVAVVAVTAQIAVAKFVSAICNKSCLLTWFGFSMSESPDHAY